MPGPRNPQEAAKHLIHLRVGPADAPYLDAIDNLCSLLQKPPSRRFATVA